MPHKNNQTVVGAFYHIRQKHKNIKLIMTGTTDSVGEIWCKVRSPYYWDHCTQEEIATNDWDVRSMGLLPERDFIALLQNAKASVNASFCEAGPGSAMDSWSIGIPIAMSDIESFREYADWLGTEAEFFDPHNSSSVADALLRILDNPAHAKESAKKSKKAMSTVSPLYTSSEYLKIFNREKQILLLQSNSEGKKAEERKNEVNKSTKRFKILKIPVFKKKRNGQNVKLSFLSIPIYRRQFSIRHRKTYVLGIQINCRKLVVNMSSTDSLLLLQKELLRLEGWKLLRLRENIDFGDKE